MLLAISNKSTICPGAAILSLVNSCLFKGRSKSPIRYRLILDKSEVFRFPECRELHVLSGIAWVTIAGEDIILTSQERASFSLYKDAAIISALGKAPLILEVL